MSPRLAVYNQLWALQEAEDYWVSVVRSGNELKPLGGGWLRKRMRAMPRDFPAVWIDIGGFGGNAYAQGGGFAVELADFSGDWSEPIDQEYTVRVFHSPDGKPDELTARVNLDDAVLRAFLRGGPRLDPDGSLPFVNRWSYRTGTRPEHIDPLNPESTVRVVTTFVLRVGFAFHGPALLAPNLS